MIGSLLGDVKLNSSVEIDIYSTGRRMIGFVREITGKLLSKSVFVDDVEFAAGKWIVAGVSVKVGLGSNHLDALWSGTLQLRSIELAPMVTEGVDLERMLIEFNAYIPADLESELDKSHVCVFPLGGSDNDN